MNQKEQMAKADVIQELLLKEFERQLTPTKRGKGPPPANSTTIATITRWLEHNGWTVDPRDTPTNLKDMLVLTRKSRVEGDAEDAA